MLAEDIPHEAFIIGGEMLDDDKRQAAVIRYFFEKGFKGFQSTGGSAQRHNSTRRLIFHPRSGLSVQLLFGHAASFFTILGDCKVREASQSFITNNMNYIVKNESVNTPAPTFSNYERQPIILD
jgi:hypothetical protein